MNPLISTSNKLFILIGVFIFGFITLFFINQSFDKLIEELDNKTVMYESKVKIGEYIAEDIQTIKALFFELASTTTSKRSRKIVIDKIIDAINKINNSLNVLENGGVLYRTIELNIAGKNSAIKRVDYKIDPNEQKLSLEVIDIKPKLIELKDMIKEVSFLLAQRNAFKKTKDMKNFMKIAKKIRRYYKTTPPFFNRMSENIKRLLYEGDIELQKLTKEIKGQKTKYLQIKMTFMVVVIFVVAIFGFWLSRIINKENLQLANLNKELKIKENSVKAILNAQTNMITVTNGKKMIQGNDAIADFFDQFDTLEDFMKKHECICDMFKKDVPDDTYITKKMYGEKTWVEYILDNKDIDFKAILNNGREDHHFSVVANKKIIDDEGNFIIVVSLSDITNVIKAKMELENLNNNLETLVDIKTEELKELNNNLEKRIEEEVKKNREKDRQIIQQSRFAALGEMLGNIAHQWRQPLSAINSTASGMELQMELGIASNDDIKKSFANIKGYVEFLTQTIEDFRNFFKEDKDLIDFNITDVLQKTLSIIDATYKDNNIEIILDIKDKLISKGKPNELSQVFLNILNNAKDAMVDHNIQKRFVHVYSKTTKEYNIIYIQDNAGGIPEDIIEKIFDPYFTTKHQSQGTGIGLYMSKNIIEKHMKGEISVENLTQEFDGITYTGACFKVVLPKVDS